MKVIYIAGPFRAEDAWGIELNIRRAEEASLDVWRCGAAAVCPHTNTRFFQGALPDEVWLKGDIAILEKCDAVLMLANWKDSFGATEEHAHALAKGIPVLYSIRELLHYLEETDE